VKPTRRALITDGAVLLAAATATTIAALTIGIPLWAVTIAAAIPTSATAVPLWLIHRHGEHVRRAIDHATAPGSTHTHPHHPPPPRHRPSTQKGRVMSTMDLYATVAAAANWLDEHNGASQAEKCMRILKVVEEAGDAAAAWIGTTGQNPRKGITHTTDQVAAELADVAFTALVAIASLGHDPATVLHTCAAKVGARIHPQPAEHRTGRSGQCGS
jgi:phosphoribosyl-ATP pyrophosphohydrolase